MTLSVRCVSLLLLSVLSLHDNLAAGLNAYNFMCDRTPQEHDWILLNAIINLEKGDT